LESGAKAPHSKLRTRLERLNLARLGNILFTSLMLLFFEIIHA
jgi:hypothetical protein